MSSIQRSNALLKSHGLGVFGHFASTVDCIRSERGRLGGGIHCEEELNVKQSRLEGRLQKLKAEIGVET